MEFLTIVLSGLIGILAPAGTIIDHTVEKSLRQQLVGAEHLQVRIDNTPSYPVLQGRVSRVRVAGRGLFPLQDVRIAVAELDTDAIALDARRLRRGTLRLVEPFRCGLRLELTEADMNRALQSPAATEWLRRVGGSVARDRDSRRRVQRYEFLNPQVSLLANQRLRFQVALREPGDAAQLAIVIESGLEIEAGRRLRLVQPVVLLNGEPVPDELLQSTLEGIPEQSDLNQLEPDGITARVLHYRIEEGRLSLAMFVQVLPAVALPSEVPSQAPSSR
jgi:hypothetical protein